MARYSLNRTELEWLVSALNHQIADIKTEMEMADDHSVVYALGELAVENKTALATKLNDVVNSGVKTISIK